MIDKLKTMSTKRRNFVIASGLAVVGGLFGALFMFRGKGAYRTVVGKVDTRSISPLGDGYYLVDGWVLSQDDLQGQSLPAFDDQSSQK